MDNVVYKPNLPQRTVKKLIAGKMPEKIKNLLIKDGIEILEIIPDSVLLEPVRTHADLQCIHLGGNELLLNEKQNNLYVKLLSYGFNVKLFRLSSGIYPYDCAVNAAIIDKNVICRYDVLLEDAKDFFEKNNYRIINVKQGYSKCSVCVVDEKSIITEDESVKNACEKAGIDVLFIRKGFVALDGYNYGFIGGASFKSDRNTLSFIGKIENHPDYEIINDFTNKRGIKLNSYSDMDLTDIGSIIPITE